MKDRHERKLPKPLTSAEAKARKLPSTPPPAPAEAPAAARDEIRAMGSVKGSRRTWVTQEGRALPDDDYVLNWSGPRVSDEDKVVLCANVRGGFIYLDEVMAEDGSPSSTDWDPSEVADETNRSPSVYSGYLIWDDNRGMYDWDLDARSR